MSSPSRRTFLKALPLATLAAGCRTQPYTASDFAIADRSPVALLPATDYRADLADTIRRGMQMLAFNPAGKRVLLKPNMVEYESGTAINTHPAVVAGAADAMLAAGAAEVIVGEAPGHRRDLEYLLGSTGVEDVLRDHRLRFVDLNHDDVRQVPLRSHFTKLDSLWLPATVLDADLVVSLPKLKTHHWAGITASMKNFFGTVPGAVYGWPKNFLHLHGIENSIVDLVATIKPALTIVDAITAMEGDGPIMGTPRPLGFIAMGTDLPAVDATLARIVGFDPAKLLYLKLASAYLGNTSEARIEQRGEAVARYRTRFAVVDGVRPWLA